MVYNPDSQQDDIMRFIIYNTTPDNRLYMDAIYTAAAGLRSIQHAPDIVIADRMATRTLDTMFRKLLDSGAFDVST